MIDISEKRGIRCGVVGMFDGVHLGHQDIVSELYSLSSRLGAVPTVFTFDRHPQILISPERAPKLLTTVAQKSELLINAGAEDVFVLIFNNYIRNLNAEAFLQMLHDLYGVDYLLVGFNHHFGKDRKGTFEDYYQIGKKIGIQLFQGQEFTIPTNSTPISSSEIRRLLLHGDIKGANKLLGHNFAINGLVQHGLNIGSTIGFPTANIKPFMTEQLIPKIGAYAAIATLHNEQRVPTMVNIGTNPTVHEQSSTIKIEAHLIGFDEDIYGIPIQIEFIERLRNEHKFQDLTQLKEQLAKDRLSTLSILHSQL